MLEGESASIQHTLAPNAHEACAHLHLCLPCSNLLVMPVSELAGLLTAGAMKTWVYSVKNLKNIDVSNNPNLNSVGISANVIMNILFGPRDDAVQFAFNNYQTFPWTDTSSSGVMSSARRRLMQSTDNPFSPIINDENSCFEVFGLANVALAGGIDGVLYPDCTQIVDVSNNKLTKLNMRFGPNSQLRILKAEGNVITNITALILPRGGPVEELNLRDNLIPEMPAAWNTKLSTKLKKIDLRENPLTGGDFSCWAVGCSNAPLECFNAPSMFWHECSGSCHVCRRHTAKLA